MTSEEFHSDFIEAHSGGDMQPGIIDLDAAEYRILPDRPPLLTRIHDFIGDVSIRFNEFKQELAYSTATERAVIHDLRPDRLWNQFWNKRVSRAERSLIAAYAAGMLGGISAETMSPQRAAAEAYSPQNAAVYHMSTDEMRNLYDSQSRPAQADDGTSALGDTLYFPWANQPIQREPASPPPPRPSPSATPSPAPEGSPPPPPPSPPKPSPPTPSQVPPSPSPSPEPSPTREIPPLERYSRVPLLSGIASIENPGQDTSNPDLFGETWAIAGSAIRTNDFYNRGRVVNFEATRSVAIATPRPPAWSTPRPDQKPLTQAAQIFVARNGFNFTDPIYYEGGYWFINGERLATEPGTSPEDPNIAFFYYLDNNDNLQIELRDQYNRIIGGRNYPLPRDTEGLWTGVPELNMQILFQPNGGYLRNIVVDGLVQNDYLQKKDTPERPLKEVLSQVGGGKIFFFEGESPWGRPIDTDGEAHTNDLHNWALRGPALLEYFKDGYANGIIWRQEQEDSVERPHNGGIDQMKAIADQYGIEMFVSSGHQFRSPQDWATSLAKKSRSEHYRSFVNYVEETIRNFRNRFARQDNLNPIVIDRPLSADGDPGVLPNGDYDYERAFAASPQEDHAPGPMMEAAADAAPKGKNEEWGTQFAVYEYLGLSRDERFGKLKGFFKQFGLKEAKVPQGAYALISDEFMEDKEFFTSGKFKQRLNELRASNPNVRIMLVLRAAGIWTNEASDEEIADVITPALEELVNNGIDIGFERELMDNSAVMQRIRELAEEKIKAQAVPTPNPTPQAAGQLIPLPNDWRAQLRQAKAPRKPKGTFARH